MRMTGIGRVLGPGRWRTLRVGAAALAALGLVGAVPPAVASASPQPALNWTEQAPATSPPARTGAMMTYDAATGKMVLFGGWNGSASYVVFGDTWTWNGTTWTQQHPATSPSARFWGAMAYDAATRTVVLFGGADGGGNVLGDTWTWNGTTWTQQHPATSPPARAGAMMAYDAATGTVVLFGGGSYLNDTWTWNGTTWTQQHQATKSPRPTALASMAYDAATRTVVLYGGEINNGALATTWTWNGTTWTKRYPATSPPARLVAHMAYDAATRTVVLFGGAQGSDFLDSFGDTWTWCGRAWTEQQPATSPSARQEGAMAYDAATRTVVLFGGYGGGRSDLNDTWTWG